MSEYRSRSDVQIGASDQPETSAAVLDPDEPFRILIVGDFSGRALRGDRAPLGDRPVRRIDCDNFDDVLAAMQVRLEIPRTSLSFRELEDFHPDRIYRAASVFELIENLRPAASTSASASAAAQTSRPGLLDDMIGETESREARAEDAGDLAAFIQRVSAKHLEDRPDASQQVWKAKVKAAVTEQMRAILHDPGFQSVEAAWRSLNMLVMRLGAEEGVEISVADATLEELTADASGLVRWLTGKKEWTLVVANYAFGQGADDARRLAILGQAARAASAPLLAEAMPPSDEGGSEWQALRRLPEARWIGLAMPRFLVRLPYGKSTSPVESFEFEEMPVSAHSQYLWGNPAFCCACLIGLAFRSYGWEMRPGMVRRIDGMPLHLYSEDGESVSKPCAEVLLSEREAEQLIEQGFMPLASVKDEDAVLLVRFCSIAEPAASLFGRWVS